jgi:hypothetical protein
MELIEFGLYELGGTMIIVNDRVVIKSHWSFLIKLLPFLLFSIVALVFPFFYGYQDQPLFLIFIQSIALFGIIQIVAIYNTKIILEKDQLTSVQNFKKTTIKLQHITEGLMASGYALRNLKEQYPLAARIEKRHAFLHLWLYLKAQPHDMLMPLSSYSTEDRQYLKDFLANAGHVSGVH